MVYDDGSEHYGISARRYAERAYGFLAGDDQGTPDALVELAGDYSCLMDEGPRPLQQQLGAALVFVSDGYNDVKFILVHDHFLAEKNPKMSPDFGTVFYPQGAFAGHTVDFLFTTCVKGLKAYTIVECDELTPEEEDDAAVARREARARAIAREGGRILRFTIADIEGNIRDCADQVSDVLCHQAERLLVQAGISEVRERDKLKRRPKADEQPVARSRATRYEWSKRQPSTRPAAT